MTIYIYIWMLSTLCLDELFLSVSVPFSWSVLSSASWGNYYISLQHIWQNTLIFIISWESKQQQIIIIIIIIVLVVGIVSLILFFYWNLCIFNLYSLLFKLCRTELLFYIILNIYYTCVWVFFFFEIAQKVQLFSWGSVYQRRSEINAIIITTTIIACTWLW